jgi:hypothetical protein
LLSFPMATNSHESSGQTPQLSQRQRIEVARDVLNDLASTLPAQDEFDHLDAVGIVENQLDRARELAVADEARNAEVLALRGEVEQIRAEQLIGRREFVLGGVMKAAAFGAGAAVAGTPIYAVYKNWFSPEAREERRQENEKRKEELENNRLGLEPTMASYYHWRVRYQVDQPGNTYIDAEDEFAKRQVLEDNSTVHVPHAPTGLLGSDTSDITGIKIVDFQTTEGAWVPKLNIYTDSEEHGLNSLGEEVLLRQEDVEEIDTRAVVLENVVSGDTRYIQINRIKASPTQFELKFMDKVTAAQ